MPRLCKVCYSPDDEKKETDVRQVGITVSVSLFANLNDPDDRHHHTDIPEPSGKDIRTFLSQENRYCRNSEEKRARQGNLPDRKWIVRIGVENGQSRRPERLPHILDVTDKCVVEPPGK